MYKNIHNISMKVDLGNVMKIVENLLATYWEVGKYWRS